MASALKVAIVGGGPSAFYCASRLFARLPQGHKAQVHIYDRLWAPHGLVRYGVAPDHPEVKNCTNKFDQTAQHPGFKFFGNVNVGSTPPFAHSLQIPISSLLPHYTHLVLSTGAYLPFTLSTLGKEATSALSLVHWYTHHPSSPPPPPLSSISHLTLIGHGNVSLDIARMLLSPLPTLQKLDIPQHVLDVLATSTIKHVSIVSRRGPAEVAFTAKEARELLTLPNASMVPIPLAILTPPVGASRQQSRILDLLRKGSQQPHGSTEKTWSLEFFRSPLSTRTGAIEYGINELDDQLRARPTGERETQKTDFVVSSVGYRSEPVEPEWFDGLLGRMRNDGGRVLDSSGNVVPYVYTSGWAANGAKGVLATTMMDAYGVAERVLTDHLGELMRVPTPLEGRDGIPGELEVGKDTVISYDDWKRIDAEEVKRGENVGKERERMDWGQAKAFLGI